MFVFFLFFFFIFAFWKWTQTSSVWCVVDLKLLHWYRKIKKKYFSLMTKTFKGNIPVCDSLPIINNEDQSATSALFPSKNIPLWSRAIINCSKTSVMMPWLLLVYRYDMSSWPNNDTYAHMYVSLYGWHLNGRNMRKGGGKGKIIEVQLPLILGLPCLTVI